MGNVLDKPGGMSQEQRIQEEGYSFPYHYVPRWERGRFAQHSYWSWGFRYLGGLQLVLDQLLGMKFGSLVDIGCGDGRFLREAARHHPDVTLLGVDYSEQAIRLAQAMNSHLRYRVQDIVTEPLNGRFDVVTLIEVLEHIPPPQAPAFVAAVAAALGESGRLVLTVPHRNVPVTPKHFQHFDEQGLRKLLEPHFDDLRFIPFDTLSAKAPLLALLERLIGGRGRYWVMTNRRLLSAFFRFYLRRYLYCSGEKTCSRIAVVGRKRAVAPDTGAAG